MFLFSAATKYLWTTSNFKTSEWVIVLHVAKETVEVNVKAGSVWMVLGHYALTALCN